MAVEVSGLKGVREFVLVERTNFSCNLERKGRFEIWRSSGIKVAIFQQRFYQTSLEFRREGSGLYTIVYQVCQRGKKRINAL